MTEDHVLRSGDKRRREAGPSESGGESNVDVKESDEDCAGNLFSPPYLISE